jgi:predicted AAA+ superfamily ATPase
VAWTASEDAFASRPSAAAARAAIVEELSSDAPRHVLVHGPPGVGKRFAARSAIGEGFERGARCVQLGRGDLRALPEILAEVAKHPRAKFVLFLEMPLCLTPYAEFHNELTAALDGGGGGSWPANATLVATALAPTGLKPGEKDEGASLAGRFGRVVAMDAE